MSPKEPRSSKSEATLISVGVTSAGRQREQPDLDIYSADVDIRLLVIDDDPAIGRLVQAAFSDHGFTTDVVTEPHIVQEQLRTGNYHVVLLDYILPGLDSVAVLQMVRDLQPGADIIVITAYPSVDSALHCLRASAFDYLTKPFPVELLQHTVERSLERRGLLRMSEEALLLQVGAAIRDRRKALGLTLADLSQRAQVSLGYLSQIELGKNSASIEMLYRIALGLRIRMADLFSNLQPGHSSDPRPKG
jgi:DNA-binding response OmpR family regulator